LLYFNHTLPQQTQSFGFCEHIVGNSFSLSRSARQQAVIEHFQTQAENTFLGNDEHHTARL